MLHVKASCTAASSASIFSSFNKSTRPISEKLTVGFNAELNGSLHMGHLQFRTFPCIILFWHTRHTVCPQLSCTTGLLSPESNPCMQMPHVKTSCSAAIFGCLAAIPGCWAAISCCWARTVACWAAVLAADINSVDIVSVNTYAMSEPPLKYIKCHRVRWGKGVCSTRMRRETHATCFNSF